MTTGSDGGNPPPGEGAITAPETVTDLTRLVPAERQALDWALQTARVSGAESAATVVVGAIRGRYGSWDIRPLLLDKAGGALQIVRFSHPEGYLYADRQAFLDELADQLPRHPTSAPPLLPAMLGYGIERGQLWIKRPYFDRLLSDFLGEGIGELKGLPSAVFGQRLILAVERMHSSGVTHGHLCPSNVAVHDEHPILIDHGFFCLMVPRLVDQSYVAPELLGGAAPAQSADVYALGKVLTQIFSENLSPTHRGLIEKMCDSDSARRPVIQEVREQLVPAARALRSVLSDERGLKIELSGGGRIEGSKVRAGRLLGRGIEPSVSSGTGSSQSGGASPKEGGLEGAGTSPARSARFEDSEQIQGGAAPAPLHLEARFARVGVALRQSRTALVFGLLTAIIVALWWWYTPYAERLQQARVSWESADPVVRQGIIHAAIVEGERAAQEVIIEDARTGTRRPGVRLGLLAVAFNSLWADELSDSDRQQALSFALASIVRDLPVKTQPLKEAHPGVQLAAIGDLEFARSDGQFDDIPLSAIATLPDPFGPPFGELVRLGVQSMGDLRARALAHIVVGNFSEDPVAKFVGVRNPADEFLAHALILGSLLDVYPEVGVQLQRRMRERDDIFTRRIEWFRLDPAGQWSQAGSGERDHSSAVVALSLGVFPPRPFTDEQLADLLVFPAATVRREAAETLTKRLAFPALASTISFLASDEHRLTRPQVVLLMSALILSQREPQNPSVASFVSAWIGTAPDAQSVLGLLVARADVEAASGGADSFNIEAARFVSNKSWEASFSQLRSLIFHREKLVRAMIYSRLDATLADERKLLEEAARSESDSRLREQLIGKLKAADMLGALPDLPQAPELPEVREEDLHDEPF